MAPNGAIFLCSYRRVIRVELQGASVASDEVTVDEYYEYGV